MTQQQQHYLEASKESLLAWLKLPLNPTLKGIVERQLEQVNKKLQ